MAQITQYSKVNNTNPLYDAKLCYNDNCNILKNQYKFTNDSPKTQMFPFPSTSDGKVFMVPDRIAQDADALKRYVIDNARSQSCFNIDPCDVYTSKYCCAPVSASNISTTTTTTNASGASNTNTPSIPSTNNISGSDLFIFFLIIGIVCIILIVLFVLFIRL